MPLLARRAQIRLEHPVDQRLVRIEGSRPRRQLLPRSLADRGHTLATNPPAWARPLGPPPPATAPRRRHGWAVTAALVELWRTRHAITAVPGLGPRPADPDDAAAFDDPPARVRALTGRRRPLTSRRPTPPPPS